MELIVSFYREYLERKESAEWGPAVVQKEGEAARRRIELFYNDGLKSVLELGQFCESIARKATESLRRVYQDADFEKLGQFVGEENEAEQERTMVSSELAAVCGKLRLGEGRVRFASEEGQRREAEEILGGYRQQVGRAVAALRELVELHKDTLKCIIG